MIGDEYEILGIIQARMGSKRLPGKTLKLMNGKPMLEQLLLNLKGSKYVKKFVVATSHTQKDYAIENFCKNKRILFYRGYENNVLSMFKNIIDLYKPNIIS